MFEDLMNDVRSKVYEVKYSSEYLDMKDDLKSAGKKIKHVVQNDLKSAAQNFGKVCQVVVKKRVTKRLISE